MKWIGSRLAPLGSLEPGAAGWLASTGDESAFVQAFKAGSNLVVRGTSQRGTNTVDTYSLSGATAAMKAIDGACA